MRGAGAIAAALALAGFAVGSRSAHAQDLVLGLQSGVYAPTLRALTDQSSEQHDSSATAFVSPAIALNGERLGIAFRYLFASYDLFGAAFDKHDLDLGLRVELLEHVHLIGGARYEIQSARDEGERAFDIVAVPLGLHLSTPPIGESGLAGYLSGAAYVYGRAALDLERTQEVLDGFAGYVLEAGAAMPLYRWIGLPLGVLASYRFQHIALDGPAVRSDVRVRLDEQVHQLNLGAFVVLRDPW